MVLSISNDFLKATTYCPGDNGAVRTCHESCINSSTSNRTPAQGDPDITRTRNLWKFCWTFIPVYGTSVSSARPCHNIRNFLNFGKTSIPVPYLLLVLSGHSYPPVPGISLSYVHPVPQHPRYGHITFRTRREILWVLYAHATITENSGSSATLSYLYPKLLEVLTDFHILTRSLQTLHNITLQI